MLFEYTQDNRYWEIVRIVKERGTVTAVEVSLEVNLARHKVMRHLQYLEKIGMVRRRLGKGAPQGGRAPFVFDYLGEEGKATAASTKKMEVVVSETA